MSTTKLQALDIYLSAQTTGVDSAIERLALADNPDSHRYRLQLLLGAGRTEDAERLARDLPLTPDNATPVIAALVAANNVEAASRVVEWAHDVDADLHVQCALSLAHRVLDSPEETRSESSFLVPGTLSTKQISNLRVALKALEAPLRAIEARRHLSSTAERKVVDVALRLHHLLENGQRTRRLRGLLERATPASKELARLVLESIAPPLPELSDRLRDEYSDDFEAKLLAVLLDGSVPGKHRTAYLEAIKLLQQPEARSHLNDLANVLIGVSAFLEPSDREQLRRQSSVLGADREAFLRYMDIVYLLREGSVEAAGREIEAIRDEGDGIWLQLKANLLAQTGETAEAAKVLERAATAVPHPEIFRRAAALAYASGDAGAALESILKAVALDPHDVNSRLNAARLLRDQQRHIEAASHFAALMDLQPDDISHAVNRAACQASAGDLEGSLQILEGATKSGQAVVTAVLARAALLQAVGKAADAFDSLDAIRASFWGLADFVGAYLQAAFNSGHDFEGHEALVQLQRLQRDGKVSPRSLQEKSVAEVVEILKQNRNAREAADSQILQGRAPWLLSALLNGGPLSWNWKLRTQELRWSAESSSDQSRYSVYATNAFFFTNSGPSADSLPGPLKSQHASTPIVADLTGLMTLHELGLLDLAAEYFGEISFPATYLAHVLPESTRFHSIQFSQTRNLKTIEGALDRGEIFPDSEGAPSSPVAKVSDLPSSEGLPQYSIPNLLDFLHASGVISDATYSSASRAQLRSGPSPTTQLLRGASVAVDLPTLRLMADLDILQPTVETLRVHLSTEDVRHLKAELLWLSDYQHAARRHTDFWRSLRKNPRFVPINQELPGELAPADNYGPGIALAAAVLAEQSGRSLLADDRVLQQLVLQRNGATRVSAFSTSHLIAALAESKTMPAHQAAQLMLQLSRWRYRFIVFPPQLLLALAAPFAGAPPGAPLREVASYAHACMRDSGLPAWSQPDPPSPAALLMLAWLRTVAEFAVLVWDDERFSNETASSLTRWAIQELLPGPPSTLGTTAVRLASSSTRHLLATASWSLIGVRSADRANRALQAIAASLNITIEQFPAYVADIVNGNER